MTIVQISSHSAQVKSVCHFTRAVTVGSINLLGSSVWAHEASNGIHTGAARLPQAPSRPAFSGFGTGKPSTLPLYNHYMTSWFASSARFELLPWDV